jgi:transcriptional regulator with XRE-family HTH domain
MAEQLGMSVNFLSYMERGLKAPSFENLERIATVCRVSVASLFEPSPKQERQRVRRATHGTKNKPE